MELFGTGGIRLETVQCETLAREIGEKLTVRGRFATNRTRIFVMDPRLRRRTPQMLREPRDLAQAQESESDVSGSDSENVEEQEPGRQEAEEEERNENGNEEGNEEGDEERNGRVVRQRKLASASHSKNEIPRSNDTQNGDTSRTFHHFRGNSNGSRNGSGCATQSATRNVSRGSSASRSVSRRTTRGKERII